MGKIGETRSLLNLFRGVVPHGMYNVREVELKVCIKHSVLHNINTHLIETPLPKMLVIPLLLNQITFCFFSFICTKKGQS